MKLPSDDDLARIAIDQDPDAGDWGPRALLGVLADDVDRASLLAAVAHAAFLSPAEGVDPPALRHLRVDRHLGADRPAIRAIARTPLAPWRLDALPPGARMRPIACPLGPSELVFARVVPTGDGWEVIAPIAVPAVPSLAIGLQGPEALRLSLEDAWAG